MQQFLKSARARTFSLAEVMRMTEAEAETIFRQVRRPETNGEPICPRCGSLTAYDCRRSHGATRWRCKDCRADCPPNKRMTLEATSPRHSNEILRA